MNTQIFTSETEDIIVAAEILKKGGLVAFPTETVYGLGANALMPDSVKSIFAAKGRPSDNPLIVHVAEKQDILKVASSLPEKAEKLIDTFSPGPLTVILPKRADLNDVVTGGLDTVAVRIPSHPIARELIRQSGVPVAAPSANLSGKPSPTEVKHVIEDMMGRIDAIVGGGACDVGLESTVIDMSGETPSILRPGGITFEQIQSILPDVIIDRHVIDTASVDEKPKSPGMKYKHYAPDAEVTVIEGDEKSVQQKIVDLLENARKENKRTGVMAMSDYKYNADYIINVGKNNVEYGHNMFTALREFDENKIDVVFAEFCEKDSLALAVKNRLYRSAANRVIRV